MLFIKIRDTIRKYSLLNPGDRVLVAVSGGPDSVCLLSILHAFSKELDLKLHIAHLDHMFRGEESAGEALFVKELASTFGLPATIERIDVPSFCAERGLSSPAGAREIRYRFLNKVADEIGADRIALGHTANDQAETLIMRLIRGAGVSGLSAIPPKRGRIIRPLIDSTRAEILDYLRQKNIDFVTDSSNLKPVYERNRIRLELMPLLGQHNPRIVETLATEAALLRDENEALEACLKAMAPTVLAQEHDVVRIGRDEFDRLLPAFKRRILRKAIEVAGADHRKMSFIHIDDALSFMSRTQTGRAIELPQGLLIERRYEAFIVHMKKKTVEFHLQLPVPGMIALPGLDRKIETSVVEGPARETGDKNFLWQAVFDYDKIALPLFIRSRRAGDSFHPSGMGGKSKKVQNYFVDEKVPRLEREFVPILSTETDIIGIVGMRTDGRFLPGAETKKALVVRVRRNS